MDTTVGDRPCPCCGSWGCSGINCPGPRVSPPYYTQPMQVYTQTLLPMLTKRELFAAMAMQGWIAGVAGADSMDEYDQNDRTFAEHQVAVAKAAAGYADALLAELGKGE